ncbi:MAG: leucine-rich repeat domain-containing protein [Muribaculaceae bacterium]|nr:leucine-rich repeat domain-containing protein [Muribaculaceae bacterium]
MRFLLLLLIPLTLLCSASVEPSPLQNHSFASSIGYKAGDTVVTIPADIRHIPPFAFFDCKSLRHVVFPRNSKCTSIGEYAFAGCENLSEISIPTGVTEIREGTFRECSSLRRINLPKKLKDIKSFAFIYCELLDSVALPQGLTHIGLNAFCRDLSLSEIYIPDSVIEIESYAFADCMSLTSARLPNNSRMLGELIFNGCSSMTLLSQPSQTPPAFDCDSFIFSPADTTAYKRCRLIVPPTAIPYYQSAQGWSLFFDN